MEKGSKKISVRIGGMSYNLVSGESEEYTRQIAARADEMIRRVTMTSPQLSQQMTTILALVNAVDDLSRQSGQLALAEQQREAAETKTTELRTELAKLRELNWEMKKELLRLSGLLHEQERQAAQRIEPAARPSSTHAAPPLAATVAWPVAATVAWPVATPVAATAVAPVVTPAVTQAAAEASVQTAASSMPAQSVAAAAASPHHEQMAIPLASAATPVVAPSVMPVSSPFAGQAITDPLPAAEPAPASAGATATVTDDPAADAPPVVSSSDVSPAAMAAWPAFETSAEMPVEPACAETASADKRAASPAPAASARILPPLGFGRSRDARPKPLDPLSGQPSASPLKNFRANPWAEPAEQETALSGPQDANGKPDDPAGPADAPSHRGPAAESPRQINQMRQTGLEEYLSRYGQGRSTVQDMRPEDEP